MARKKQYIEEDVINKAMHVFWYKGYENTSMQMLEKEMGINKFSIYASFGNKQGLFLESLKNYKAKRKEMFDKLRSGTKGVEDIKQFFYDSVKVCDQEGNQKGCLLTNTYYEFSNKEDSIIHSQVTTFMNNLKTLFIEKLRMNTSKSEEIIGRQANFLVLAKHGLAAATRVNNKEEIEDFIEMTFKNI
ncbi:TetR/AcrR family transcriptional regulator [Aquimarina sp. W85]|uniref:TetR/AcrR family transcriptional regulator n=1 Tax=Aquimarina rhodophyticola TaxID=3342246 RepID=UPI0036721FA5